jgi:protein-tyrosine phosphatase
MPTQEPPKPDPNTYWVVPDKFLAGEYPGAYNPDDARKKLRRFLDIGVRRFIDLTEDGELEPYVELLTEEAGSIERSYERIPIRDVDVPKEAQTMVKIIDAIDRAIAAGGIAYVHCWGGIGRTGLAVACWLQGQGKTPDEALVELANRWRTSAKSKRKSDSPETTERRRWIKEWPQYRSRLNQN